MLRLLQCVVVASRQLETEELAESLEFHRGLLNRLPWLTTDTLRRSRIGARRSSLVWEISLGP